MQVYRKESKSLNSVQIEETMTSQFMRRRDQTPKVYICATMWHENETEMMLMLKSIFK